MGAILDKKYLDKIKGHFLSYATVRRDVIKQSDDALHFAKRAIFAMHRDNQDEAKEKLEASSKILSSLQTQIKKEGRIEHEGSYRAALEEFTEAALFQQFLLNKKIGVIPSLTVDYDTYVGGLCDVPGELYRYAIKAATNKDMATVKQCASMGEEIVGALIECNLTSYLRNKFDQAKQAVQKLEQMMYEVTLRN